MTLSDVGGALYRPMIGTRGATKSAISSASHVTPSFIFHHFSPLFVFHFSFFDFEGHHHHGGRSKADRNTYKRTYRGRTYRTCRAKSDNLERHQQQHTSRGNTRNILRNIPHSILRNFIGKFCGMFAPRRVCGTFRGRRDDQ